MPAVSAPQASPAPAAGAAAVAQDTVGNAAIASSLGQGEPEPESALLAEGGAGGVGTAAPPGAVDAPAPPERPTSLSAGGVGRVAEIDPDLAADLIEADEVSLWETSLGSPEAVTADLLGRGAATMDAGGAMALPRVDPAVAAGAGSGEELGEAVAGRLPVTRITAERRGSDIAVVAQVNPDVVIFLIALTVFVAALLVAFGTYRARHVDIPNATLPPNARNLGRLPVLPEAHRWHDQGPGNGFQAQRRANAPDLGVGTHTMNLPAGGITAQTSTRDPLAPTMRRPLGTITPTRNPTFGGARNYPMTNADYTEPTSGEVYGRGHLGDHDDGDAASTASARNYVPQTQAFNEGGRNHAVRGMRGGGGVYEERDHYGSAPLRTQDGSAVPQHIEFGVFPTGGGSSEWDVPNNDAGYGPSRSMAQLNAHSVPSGTMAGPPVVTDPRTDRLMERLIALGILALAAVWQMWNALG